MISSVGEVKATIALDIVKTYIYDASDKIAKASKDALNSFVEGDELTTYGFVDLKKKGDWGMPGQTRHYVKTVDDLINANSKMSKEINNKRKPKGYVAW